MKAIRRAVSTSNLLLKRHNDVNGHVENAKLSLRFVALQMCHAHPSKFLEGVVNVSNADPEGREEGGVSEVSFKSYYYSPLSLSGPLNLGPKVREEWASELAKVTVIKLRPNRTQKPFKTYYSYFTTKEKIISQSLLSCCSGLRGILKRKYDNYLYYQARSIKTTQFHAFYFKVKNTNTIQNITTTTTVTPIQFHTQNIPNKWISCTNNQSNSSY